MLTPVKLVECPRDAMQGLSGFIPTEVKSAYINSLLKVGFDTLDFGSFVSPKAIPQMRDTREVLSQLDLSNTNTKLLAIAANLRGVTDAASFPEITSIGYPFSISETFQQRNTNSGINDSILLVEKMLSICTLQNKEAVVYLSMGFGNPYGDPWSVDIVVKWGERLSRMGVKVLSLADTTGIADDQTVRDVTTTLIQNLPDTEIGVHLHSTPSTTFGKLSAAFESGCRRFDSAMLGFGGCPMAADDLTGNVATEDLIETLNRQGVSLSLNLTALATARELAAEIFRK